MQEALKVPLLALLCAEKQGVQGALRVPGCAEKEKVQKALRVSLGMQRSKEPLEYQGVQRSKEPLE
jgi:hypothetical protein